MRILGIDPGVSGALALFDESKTAASGLRWVIEDMPIVGDPGELNAPVLRNWLRHHAPDHAFVELVNAMPVIVDRKTGQRKGMPATSSFRFGGMFFSIKAVLGCCDIPISLVTPAAWKRAAGLKGPDKEASRQRALQLFPDQAHPLRLKKHQNRAEAMLIARFGLVRLSEQLPLRAAE